MGFLALLLPALIPVVADGVRGLVGMLTGGRGAKPQNVDEAVKLMQAEVEKLRALAELDKPAGEISRWVADLRASFRYLAAAMIILGTFGYITGIAGGVLTADTVVTDTLLQMTGSVFSFMFGDRMYLSLKNGKK